MLKSKYGNIYSVNDANVPSFPPAYQRYLEALKSGETGRKYTSRYVGSLVADFHRTLIKGGIFFYPPTSDYRNGKLRLLYEANPIGFIAEQAGGIATDGTQSILQLTPKTIHQRVPLVVGSATEMREFAQYAEQYSAVVC